MIKLSHYELETQKEDIRVQAFNDELVKISAYQILGPDVDLNNLTPEQMEKLAQWKFPLLRAMAKGARKVVEGGKKAGKYLGEKGKDLVEGVGTVAKGVVDVAKVPASMGLDAAKAVGGAAAGAVTGAAAAAKEGYESGAPKPKVDADAAAKPKVDADAAKIKETDIKPKVDADAAKSKANPEMPGKTALPAVKEAPEPEKMKANPNSGNIPSKQTAFERNNPPKKAKEQTFGQAFAANRKAGKKTFDWRGKSYTTEMA